MANYRRIGEKIKQLRREKNLTQEKLAELAKIDPKSIVEIERGKRNPTLKTLNKISLALKTPLLNLLSS